MGIPQTWVVVKGYSLAEFECLEGKIIPLILFESPNATKCWFKILRPEQNAWSVANMIYWEEIWLGYNLLIIGSLREVTSRLPSQRAGKYGAFMSTLLSAWISLNRQTNCQGFNSLCPDITIWWHRFGSILAQIMACCLMAQSRYLNQCWHIISDNCLKASSQEVPQPPITQISLKITLKSPGEQWVKMPWSSCDVPAMSLNSQQRIPLQTNELWIVWLFHCVARCILSYEICMVARLLCYYRFNGRYIDP